MADPAAGVAGYGSINVPASVPTRTGASSLKRTTVLRATAGIAILAAIALVAFVAVSGPSPSVLLESAQATTNVGSTLPPTADHDGTVQPPTEEDVKPFEEDFNKVLKFIGIESEEMAQKTDLGEACLDLVKPCVATVGSCLEGRITKTTAGHYTVGPTACQCFARGLSDVIAFEKRPELNLRCSFSCLDSISDVFDGGLLKLNGNTHNSVKCPRTFQDMAESVYGSRNDKVASEMNTDSMTVQDVTDANVIRAADAFKAHINAIRRHECVLKPEFTSEPQVLYAKRGMVQDGLGEYRLEMQLGQHEYVGRIVHLPHYEQIANPDEAKLDPDNLEGRFRVMVMSPEPCVDGPAAQLAITEHQVQKLNSQQLTWKAKYDAKHHEGKTRADFGMGYKPPSKAVQKAHTVTLSTEGFTPPPAFDARDHRSGEDYCRAFHVLDQGSCGSCYAFAAASAFSARMCRQTETKFNLVLSPQEMMDCDNGCDGGWPLTVYEKLGKDGGYCIENFCDPYTEKKSTCGGYCGNGNKYHGLDGSARIVGGATVDGVKQMQKELLEHGPGVVAFEIFSDFYSYHSGVYQKSADATPAGWHAATLVGWGTENDVDYWLVQNSWGTKTGDAGFWKIRRGTNECGIEDSGLTVIKPEVPSVCPNAFCDNGGTPYKDCSCRCNGFWSGDSCQTCSLTCENGGKPSSDCSGCICPTGFSGPTCSGGGTISPLASCSGDSTTTVTVNLKYSGQSEPPTQKSFLGLYPKDSTNPLAPQALTYICGTTYNKDASGGLCPASASMAFHTPAVGQYKIYVHRFLPPNEFGQSGYNLVFQEDDLIGYYDVLQTGCDAQSLQDAKTALDPATHLNEKVQLEEDEDKKQQEEMDARLDAVTPVEEALKEDTTVTPSLHVSGIDDANPVVWTTGAPIEVCYTINPSENVNPKSLIIYTGDGSGGQYWPTALEGGGFDSPTPAESTGCMEVAVSPGLPGDSQYTIMLQQEWNKVFVSTSFTTAEAHVQWRSYMYDAATLRLWVQWEVTKSHTGPKDTIKIYNSAGTVVDWFFTSCKCKGPEGDAGVAKGIAEVDIQKAGAVKGGYTAKFFPGGSELVAGLTDDWINWNAIGW